MRSRNEDKINLRGSKRSGFNIELAARGSGLSSSSKSEDNDSRLCERTGLDRTTHWMTREDAHKER